jgi:PAS domain S-box-containing protein
LAVTQPRIAILVVDDRPENVLALRAVLDHPDYDVVTAASGREALRHAVARNDLAVILLDVHMPGIDGLTTARLIRERSRDVPIIFLTADSMDQRAVDEAYASGAVDYLVKPLDPKVVRSKVAVFVDLYRKTEELRRKEEQLLELERQRSAEALRESEAQYEATFDQAPIGIAHMSLAGTWRRVNRHFCAAVGGAPEEILCLGLADMVHAEDLPTLRAALEEMRDEGLASFSTEARWRHRSGTILWVNVTLSLLRDSVGRPRHVIVIVDDIDDRKRNEEAQRLLAECGELFTGPLDAQLRLTRLVQLVQLIVPRLADLCVVQLEDQAAPVAVAPAEPAVVAAVGTGAFTAAALGARGQRALVDLDGMDAPPTAGPIAILAALGARTVLAVPLLARDRVLGALTMARRAGRRFHDRDIALADQLAHRAGLALDNALLYAEAQDAIRVREEFLSIASHELRTPLTPLQIQLQRLTGARSKAAVEVIAPERLRPILVRAERQVQRLAALIDNLLDVSRITAGRMRLELETGVDLAELVHDVATRFGEELARSACPLELVAEGPVVGTFDRLRLEQVVTNLLSNAVKYGPGKPIAIRVAAVGDQAILAVTDHGIGVPPDKVKKIFDRFERAVSAQSYGGLGLGLYIARQIVDGHGGTIEVESELGVGSTFTVKLPRRSV